MNLILMMSFLLISVIIGSVILQGKWRGYPFWVDAAGAVTILNPLTKVAITTLPFEGKSTKQRLMGISVSGGTPTFLNNIRVLIGNSLPSYRYIEITPNAFDSDSLVGPLLGGVNYVDLGGQEIQEGDTLTITAVGTGAFSGILHVDDLEGSDPRTPQGNYVMLKCGGTNDGAAAISAAGGDLDARKLENTRKYSLFKTELMVEDQIFEICIVQVGSRTVAVPIGTMQWKRAPITFSGLEWNNGQVIIYVQVAAATKIDLRLHTIESQLEGAAKTENAPGITQITSDDIPGSLAIIQSIGSSAKARDRKMPTLADLRR